MSPRSLWPRMILAVILLVGFYVFAIGIAGALLFGIYAQVHYSQRISFRLSLVLLLGAGAILYAIFPRADKFDPPWPMLDAAGQPRLFRKLQELAAATKQEMPSEVYLVPDVNAWVSDRGGRMGIGSRRVMGIGLPLLQILNVSELGAVLAHEFGHYYGGDTKLGPWLFKTRATIGRTLDTLEETNRFLKIPFTLYGKLFLRTTQAVSRRQEFLADEFAARIAGADHLSNALKTLHGQAPGYVFYWNDFVAPVLEANYRPRMTEGYGRFASSTATAETVAEAIQHEMTEGKQDPYDSHPTLRERVEAIDVIKVEGENDNDMAITLLDDIDSLERELIGVNFPEDVANKLEPIGWEDVGEKVFLHTWRRWYDTNKAAVKGCTPRTLPRAMERLGEIARGLRSPNGKSIPPEHGPSAAAFSLGVGFAMALLRDDWEFKACPTAGIYFFKGDGKIDPLKLVNGLATGNVNVEGWDEYFDKLGVLDLDFGDVSDRG